MPDFFCIHDYILHFGPTQWIRIINKSLEVYKNEVEKDTFEQNLQKRTYFVTSASKTILWVKSLAQVCARHSKVGMDFEILM